MEKKDIIAAKLAEWGLRLTDDELAQLVPAYDNLLRHPLSDGGSLQLRVNCLG